MRGVGRYHATRAGFGFITPDDDGDDLYVPAEESGGALHGDRVAYHRTRPPHGRFRGEATVVSVLERRLHRLTGVVRGSAKGPHLVPDNPRLPSVMRLRGRLGSVSAGDRILCELHDAGSRRPPAAMLVRVLGDADDPRGDFEIVRAEFALPEAFPPAVTAAADAWQLRTDLEGCPDRRDFRDELTFTIDPSDARDFDDAVSLQHSPSGDWLLRVHIADVAEAVPPGSELDAEARLRGNSTYLPGNVIPMLPESLANEKMSVAPGTPRLVVTVSARIAAGGGVIAYRIEEGLITSRHRLDYDQVQAQLDGETPLAPDLDRALREMDRLAQTLRQRRLAHGGFDLTVPETEITLGSDGVPATVGRRRHTRSHQIVEEFMILANRLACAYAREREQPYLFRIHRSPDPVAVGEVLDAVATLAPGVPEAARADLAALRRWLGGLPDGPPTWRIHGLFLRAMQRAIYADQDAGHFGLGLRGYGHFTSPIRRYPDLINHRIVKWALRQGKRPVPRGWRDELPEIARHSSATEERSQKAERELLRIKVLRWAQAHLGDSFRGTVVAVVSPGYFVEFDETPVEGLVPRDEVSASLPWRYEGPRVGPGTGGLQVGLPVIVQIARVDMRNRTLTLVPRAAGRRAQQIDPQTLDPLLDVRGAPDTARESGGKRRGRRRRDRKVRKIRRGRRTRR